MSAHLNITTPVYVLLRTYSDGSGVLSSFGPFESEDAAHAAIKLIQDVVGIDITGNWEVVKTWPVEIREDGPGK